MGYHIKYEELSRVREGMLHQLDSWLEQIGTLKGSLMQAADMTELKGAAGDSVRNYLKEVHLSLVEIIENTIQVYRDQLVLQHRDGHDGGIPAGIHRTAAGAAKQRADYL